MKNRKPGGGRAPPQFQAWLVFTYSEHGFAHMEMATPSRLPLS